ncbi:MAG: ComEC/Rec2 family competence protein, partial [Rhodoferax sp.]
PLDRVVLSHRDMDHVGGAAAVLAMQPQAQVLTSVDPGQLLLPDGVAQRCIAGQRWEWDGVQFAVLHPAALDYDSIAKSNAMSCVLHISAGGRAALLVGDIEQTQEARLVAAQAPLRADVLLVPHHGSKTSSSAAFLDAVAPQVASVQSGYRNRFGHPHPAVVERYRERHIELVDSPHCGAFTWRSWQVDMPQNEACIRAVDLRYWHHHVP